MFREGGEKNGEPERNVRRRDDEHVCLHSIVQRKYCTENPKNLQKRSRGPHNKIGVENALIVSPDASNAILVDRVGAFVSQFVGGSRGGVVIDITTVVSDITTKNAYAYIDQNKPVGPLCCDLIND